MITHAVMGPKTCAVSILCIGLFGLSASSFAQNIITTIAGSGSGDGVPATWVSGYQAWGVVLDNAGNLYFTESNHVRKVATNGVLSTVAGRNAPAGFSGDGGPATLAQLDLPRGIAIDASGNLYIADSGNHRVRKISADGLITTVAGDGTQGFGGDGGPAVSAQLNSPWGVALDAGGNLYIGDSGNHRIRKLAADGTITTVAGTGVPGYSGDGGVATSAQFNRPQGVAVDANGNLFVADQGNYRIRKVGADGIVTTAAGNGNPGLISSTWLALDAGGNLFYISGSGSQIRKVATDGIITTVAGTVTWGYSGDNGPATAAQFSLVSGVAIDAGGNLYVADTFNSRIRRIATDGTITTVMGGGSSGDGGAATQAQFYRPQGVAFDSAGNLYVADSSNLRVRKIAPSGIVTTVAGNGTQHPTPGFDGDGGPATSAQVNFPQGVAADAGGNLYITDLSNRIRKVTPDGIISSVMAWFNQPRGVAVDASGNLYVAESGFHRIRKVATTGMITTVAGTGLAGYSGDGGPATSAQLDTPYAVALDSMGSLYIADYGNHRVRRVAPDGTITTVAGNGIAAYSGDNGPATSASLNRPRGLAIDGSGNLYIADYQNHAVRRVTPDGIITTVAGTGTLGFSGDNGPATSAQLRGPFGLALDAAGDLYVADLGNDRIRKIDLSSANGAAVTVRLDLVPGWNLLGNSTGAALGVSSAFGNPAKVKTVWKWVPAKAKWAFYTPTMIDGGASYAWSKWYVPLTSVASGEGFWVNAKTAFSVQLAAPSAVESSAFKAGNPNALASAWNLIAIGDGQTPSAFNRALSVSPPAAGETPVNLVSLWGWEPVRKQWYFYAPNLEAQGGGALADYIASKNYLDFGSKALEPGIGFWVNKAGASSEQFSTAQSSLQRDTSPVVSEADKATLASDNTAFALDVYRQLLDDPAKSAGNLFFSPLSISVALAMTYAGAKGHTALEMESALHFSLPQERLHPALDWLDLELASRGQGALGQDGKPFRLRVSNSLWGDAKSVFEAPFLDMLAANYGAGMNLVDFRGNAEASRIHINDWVAEKTEQRIKDLIPPGVIDGLTRLVLTNAVYFNAAWQSKFQASATQTDSFTKLDGSATQVAMMNQTRYFPYAAGSGYQALELPYDGGELGMVVILPDAGGFEQFERSLTGAQVQAILGSLKINYVQLGLPKFRIAGESFSLKATMQKLGMNTAFSVSQADFSGISTTEYLYISDIRHKAFVDVDENGTEAAAATGVGTGMTGMPPPPKIVKVDRPFLFAIVDKITGAIVFWGRVIEPKSG